jgi:hypothetical protein
MVPARRWTPVSNNVVQTISSAVDVESPSKNAPRINANETARRATTISAARIENRGRVCRISWFLCSANKIRPVAQVWARLAATTVPFSATGQRGVQTPPHSSGILMKRQVRFAPPDHEQSAGETPVFAVGSLAITMNRGSNGTLLRTEAADGNERALPHIPSREKIRSPKSHKKLWFFCAILYTRPRPRPPPRTEDDRLREAYRERKPRAFETSIHSALPAPGFPGWCLPPPGRAERRAGGRPSPFLGHPTLEWASSPQHAKANYPVALRRLVRVAVAGAAVLAVVVPAPAAKHAGIYGRTPKRPASAADRSPLSLIDFGPAGKWEDGGGGRRFEGGHTNPGLFVSGRALAAGCWNRSISRTPGPQITIDPSVAKRKCRMGLQARPCRCETMFHAVSVELTRGEI